MARHKIPRPEPKESNGRVGVHHEPMIARSRAVRRVRPLRDDNFVVAVDDNPE